MRTDAALVQDRHLDSIAPLRLVDDRRLVDEAQEGSEGAFEELVERHRGPLLEFCRRLLGFREDAEDVVQQTFLVAWAEISRAQGPRALRPWLYGIARHRCLTLLRARRAGSVSSGPEPAVDDLAATVTARDELRAVLTDLARLPDDQRAALVLAELGDVSHDEIAQRLGCRREKVKALTYQARNSLAAGRHAREIPCAEIREQLTTLRGAALRRASLRRHLRDCAGCRMFRDQLRGHRSPSRALPSLLPIAALKRIISGLSGAGGAGASAAGLGSSAVSGAGLVAAVVVSVAIPIAGVSVVLSERGDDRGAWPTHAAGADGRYGAAPARAHPSASGGPRENSSVTVPIHDGARAGDRPPRAAGSATAPAPVAADNGGGREAPDRTSSPAQRESETPSHNVKPPGADAPPRPSSKPVPASPAVPRPPSRPDTDPPQPRSPVPSAPPRPRGHPTPEHPAPPAAPSPPSPTPRSAPDERSPQPSPARTEPPTDPAPRTDAGPSPPATGTRGGHDGDERDTSGPPAQSGGHRP